MPALDLEQYACAPAPYTVGALSANIPRLERLPLGEVIFVAIDLGTVRVSDSCLDVNALGTPLGKAVEDRESPEAILSRTLEAEHAKAAAFMSDASPGKPVAAAAAAAAGSDTLDVVAIRCNTHLLLQLFSRVGQHVSEQIEGGMFFDQEAFVNANMVFEGTGFRRNSWRRSPLRYFFASAFKTTAHSGGISTRVCGDPENASSKATSGL